MQYALLVYSDQSAWEGIDEAEAARLRAGSMPRWIALFEELGSYNKILIKHISQMLDNSSFSGASFTNQQY
jgi:hypothetical protein